MDLIKAAKFAISQIDNLRFDLMHSLDQTKTKQEREIVAQLKQKGYYVLENFISKDWCNEAIVEIDAAIKKYGDKIWVDENNSDHRLFGLDRVSKKIREFYENETLIRLIQSYEGAQIKDGFTLAGKLIAKPSNLGSGGGWHRDSVYFKQSKALLYLNDVDVTNGPFQFIEGSHHFNDLFQTSNKYQFPVYKNRFEDTEIAKILEEDPQKLKTFTAKAGTVLLVDTRGIHRGMPIEKGERYALTNYIWVRKGIAANMKKLMISSAS